MAKNVDATDHALDDHSFAWKRAVVGGISLACLLLAGLIYAASPDLNNVLLAALARIGVVLFAIWLALPQLRFVMSRLPSALPLIALVLVILCAARPSLFRVVGSLAVVTTALIAISNWMRKVTAKSK